jgi:uncharacterized membrane protein YccC
MSLTAELQPRPPSRAWRALWRALTHFDRSRIHLSIGARNAVGIALPLAAGVYFGSPSAGVVAAVGALNVAAADDVDPYRHRFRRMLIAAGAVTGGVFVGGLAGINGTVAVVASTLWALAAGFAVSLGPRAGDFGAMSLVVLLIYAAHLFTAAGAFWAALAAFGGGLLQTAISVALWPARRLQPDQRLIGNFYIELANAAIAPRTPGAPPLVSEQSNNLRESLTDVEELTTEAGRYVLLVAQAERIRLSLHVLRGMRTRGETYTTVSIERLLELASLLLRAAGRTIQGGPASEPVAAWIDEAERIAEYIPETRMAVSQLGAALKLAAGPTEAGARLYRAAALAQRQFRLPWRLQVDSRLATLRANLSLDSSACRHAIRLAICVALADTIARIFHAERSYWTAMTVALVLKPDFGGTFSRGVLRLAGTYAGLIVATLIVHFITASAAVQVVFIGILAFFMRSFGLANYGILVTALSALVVFLFSLTGVAPRDVIAARALNTTIGGALALAIYWIWPTRESTQAPPAFARMLDNYRHYFRAVSRLYIDGPGARTHDLERSRIEGRRARSNAETAIARLEAEPNADTARVAIAQSALVTSHRLIHGVMALEAGATSALPEGARAAMQEFASDVEKTLYYLASRLQGSSLMLESLPDIHPLDPGPGIAEPFRAGTAEIAGSLGVLAGEVYAWANDARLE